MIFTSRKFIFIARSAVTPINDFLNDGKIISHIARFSNWIRPNPDSASLWTAFTKQKRGGSEDHPRLLLEGNFPKIP